MGVRITNTTDHDIDVDDGRGGRLKIPAGETVDCDSEVASGEMRAQLATGDLKIEDEQEGEIPPPDDDK